MHIAFLIALFASVISFAQVPMSRPFSFAPRAASGPQAYGSVMSTITDVCLDSEVYSLAMPTPNRIVAGGYFYFAGQCSGGGRVFSMATGLASAPFDYEHKSVNGVVQAVTSDGSDGWYIAGDFKTVGTVRRVGLAHIMSDDSVDLSFDANMSYDLATGSFQKILKVGSTLYVAGGMYINSPRNGVLTDVTIGNVVTPASALASGAFDSSVLAVVPDGYGGWFVGGDFTKVQGYEIDSLAHLNADGSVDTGFSVSFERTDDTYINPNVSSLLLVGSTLYVGGSFTKIGGVDRYNLASVSATTGVPTAWNPKVSGNGVITLDKNAAGDILVGGRFSQVGASYYGSSIAAASVTSANLDVNFPKINKTVEKVISDGSGGWYAAGSFSYVNGSFRQQIVHILADHSIDDNFYATFDSAVYTMALSGSTLFVGGNFYYANGLLRQHLAALDAATGDTLSWTADVDSSVTTMTVDGSTLYIGGKYVTSVAGVSRTRLAAVDTSSAAVLSWNPAPNDGARDMTVYGSVVYVVGDFTTIAGVSRNRIAALSSASGVATSWNPNANNIVGAVAVDASTVYVGGEFSNIGGQSRTRLAALDPITGNAISGWNPGADAYVYTLKVLGSSVFVGGAFDQVAGQVRQNMAAIDTTTGNATTWIANSSDVVRTIATDGTDVVWGGDFNGVSGTVRNGLVAIDSSTGGLTSWNPNMSRNGSVYDLFVYGSQVYVAGSYGQIGGQSRSNLAVLDDTTAAADATWAPQPNFITLAVVADATQVYAGGFFWGIGGASRNTVAAVNKTNGAAIAGWDADISGSAGVRALVLNGSNLFVLGSMTNLIQGTYRRRLAAAFDVGTGATLQAYDAKFRGYGELFTGATDGTSIFLGGTFYGAGHDARQNLFSVNAVTGALNSWDPQPDGEVHDLVADGTNLFAGGFFGYIGTTSRQFLSAFDLGTGALTSFVASADSAIWTLAQGSGSTMYVGGDFANIGGAPRSRLAQINQVTGLAEPWVSGADSTVYAIALQGSSLYAGGTFTSMGGELRSYAGAVDTGTGAATNWSPTLSNYVGTFVVTPTTVYMGGGFYSVNGVDRNKLAAVDTSLGSLTSWDGAPNGSTLTMASNGTNKIYVGGYFSAVNSVRRDGILALDATTGVLTTWNPNAEWGYINDLLAVNSTLYAAGYVTSAAGEVRNHLVSFNSLGKALSWDPQLDSESAALSVYGNTLFVGGYFSNVAGQARDHIAAFDLASSGDLLAWNPTLGDDYVIKMSGSTSGVYVAGKKLQRFDLVTGFNTGWNPHGRSQGGWSAYQSFVTSGDSLYVSGTFIQIGGSLQKNINVVDTTTGFAKSWAVDVDGYVDGINLSGDIVYLAGAFTNVNNSTRKSLAAVHATTGAVQGWTVSDDFFTNFGVITRSGNKVYIGGGQYYPGTPTKKRFSVVAIDATTGNLLW